MKKILHSILPSRSFISGTQSHDVEFEIMAVCAATLWYKKKKTGRVASSTTTTVSDYSLDLGAFVCLSDISKWNEPTMFEDLENFRN